MALTSNPVSGDSREHFSGLRIRSISVDRWEIVDEHDEVRFVGTPQECETVLDRAENVEERVSWLHSFIVWALHSLRPERNRVLPPDQATVGRVDGRDR